MSTKRTTLSLAACGQPASHRPVAVCALEVRPGESRIRLIPAGTFDAPRGSMKGDGPWHLDEQGALRLIQLAAGRSTDIAIDYEHQTLLSERNGRPAPAAGWVDPRSLEWAADGLYGRVQWTAAAQAAIDGAEYRYLSPVFPYDPVTGEVLDLLHLALTNTPAIDDGAITQLAAARLASASRTDEAPQDPQEIDTVKREQLIAALGLKADATDAQIEQGLAALKSQAQAQADQIAALRQALELKDDDKAEDAIAALKAKATAKAEPDMSQYVPRAVFEETTQQLAALKANGQTAELDGLIEQGLKDGRIPGQATADWLRNQGIAACKAHLEGAPAIAALKTTQTHGKPPKEGEPGQDGLTDEELAVCKNMGLTAEQYRQANTAA